MNLEKALAFDERIQEMNFSRKKLDQDLVSANSHLKYQDFLLRNYQDLMHEKNMLRKEMATEIEIMRKDRLESRKHILEVRNLRAELESDKRKAFLDRRARDLQATKKEMLGIVTNYLDYKSTRSITRLCIRQSAIPPPVRRRQAELSLGRRAEVRHALLDNLHPQSSQWSPFFSAHSSSMFSHYII